jgi:hypothetical protein
VNGDLNGDQAFITLLNPASSGSVQVTASFYGSRGHLRGQSSAGTVSAGTRQTIIANSVLGTAPLVPFSVLLTANGPIMAESAQYYNGSPNVGQHPGVNFEAVPQGGSDLCLSDLATTLPDGAAVTVGAPFQAGEAGTGAAGRRTVRPWQWLRMRAMCAYIASKKKHDDRQVDFSA